MERRINPKTSDHVSLKLLIFCMHTASFMICISYVQDFGEKKFT